MSYLALCAKDFRRKIGGSVPEKFGEHYYEVFERGYLLIRLKTVRELREFRDFIGKDNFKNLNVLEVKPFNLRG